MRARLALVAALLATMIAVAPGPAASPASAVSCPADPTAETIITLGWELGPLAQKFPPAIGFINENGRACFGGDTLRFRAFVADPGGIGGASVFSLSPRWFDSPSMFIFAVDARHRDPDASVPFTGIYVPPAFGNVQGRFLNSWVAMTAHFVDKRAEQCRATGLAGSTPSRQQAIRICQAELVLLSIARAPGAPDTAIADTPSDQASADRWLVVIGVGAAIATALTLLDPRNRKRPGR